MLEYFLDILGDRSVVRHDHYLDLEVDTTDITIIFMAACNGKLDNEALASRFTNITFPAPDQERLLEIIIRDINAEKSKLEAQGKNFPILDYVSLREKVRGLINHYEKTMPGITSRKLSPLIIQEIIHSQEVDALFRNTTWAPRVGK